MPSNGATQAGRANAEVLTTLALLAVLSAGLGSEAYAAAAPKADRATDKACPDNLGGTQMILHGPVMEVGHDGFSQYMVVADDDTSCRVVVFVNEGDNPCAYKDRVAMALKVRKADNTEVNYYDGGGNEPYFCEKQD